MTSSVSLDEAGFGSNGRQPTAPAAVAPPHQRGRLDLLTAALLALSLNGFFVYLGILDIVGVSPRAAITGPYYAALGAAMIVLAWRQRGRLRQRWRDGGRPVRMFVLATAALAVWFQANVLLLSEGTLSRRLAAQLLLWTLPTALLAFTLSRRQLEDALRGVVALAGAFLAIELLAVVGDVSGARFSPIDELDPITAAHIPALGAIAWLGLGGERARTWLGSLLVFALVAGAVLPGSRGPLVALVAGIAVVLALAWRPFGVRVVGAVALGLVVGSLVASQIGSVRHLVSDLPATQTASGPNAPISSLRIRQRLIEKAVREIPQKPLFGHGVGMLVDDTPEAHRMGIAGVRTYPHNNFVEAAYSLGILGLALFCASVAAALWATAVVVRRRAAHPLAPFAVAFFVFAFLNANVSGELAAYPWSWTAAALVLALFATTRPAVGEAAGRP